MSAAPDTTTAAPCAGPCTVCDCREGRDPCHCGKPPEQPITPLGIWDDELRRPLLSAALYLGVIFASLLASHFVARGGA